MRDSCVAQVLIVSHDSYMIMVGYSTVKLPAALIAVVDEIVKSGQYSSRAEYVKELIRNDLRQRGLLQGAE